MTDRDEKGRLLPGHKGSNQFSKQEQDTQPTDTPPFDGDFDDAIIFIAESYQGKPRVFVGLLAVCEDLRRNKSTDFASYLRQAYINRRQKRDTNTVTPGVIVSFTTAPSGMYVDDGKLIEAADARAEWARRTGHSDEPPPSPPPPAQTPTKPVLVQPIDDVDDGDDEDQRPSDGVDMNDLLRSIPPPRFTRKRDDEPW